MFEAPECYYHYCSCQEAPAALTEEDIQRGIKKREVDEQRKHYIQGYSIIEMYKHDWWKI